MFHKKDLDDKMLLKIHKMFPDNERINQLLFRLSELEKEKQEDMERQYQTQIEFNKYIKKIREGTFQEKFEEEEEGEEERGEREGNNNIEKKKEDKNLENKDNKENNKDININNDKGNNIYVEENINNDTENINNLKNQKKKGVGLFKILIIIKV